MLKLMLTLCALISSITPTESQASDREMAVLAERLVQGMPVPPCRRPLINAKSTEVVAYKDCMNKFISKQMDIRSDADLLGQEAAKILGYRDSLNVSEFEMLLAVSLVEYKHKAAVLYAMAEMGKYLVDRADWQHETITGKQMRLDDTD